MSVLVSMRVKVKDWGAFRDASNWAADKGLPPGCHSIKVYRDESDPNLVLVLQEWDSHDDFHKASDEIGPEFQKRAKTEGLEWITFVWKLADGVKQL